MIAANSARASQSVGFRPEGGCLIGAQGDIQSWEEWRLAADDRLTYKTAAAAAAMALLRKLLEG